MEYKKDKYILIYTDTFDRSLLNYNLPIIRLLLNNEEKNNNDILEIYSDQYTENLLIENAFIIIYVSKFKRSRILINLIVKFNKYIIDDVSNINELIQLFLEKHKSNSIENINSIIELSINIFKENYFKLKEDSKDNLKKNIKIEYVKVLKNIKDLNDIMNDKKIHMITYFKNSENNILNTIQKKCIIENSRNKFINKVLVIGDNLKEIFKETDLENIILYPFNDNVSFKDLLYIANKHFENKIICLIRSDIIILNQNELEDIEDYLLSNKNDIYCLSRMERLINGTIQKSRELSNLLYSTEQDAWIFKLPLENIDSIDDLENIYFYEKYSELYFNNFLKINNYNLLNDTNKYKIIRLLANDNIENRLLLNAPFVIPEKEDIYLLPDNESLDKISIEQLVKILNINSKDLYYLKCELFNKYFADKIIKNLS